MRILSAGCHARLCPRGSHVCRRDIKAKPLCSWYQDCKSLSVQQREMLSTVSGVCAKMSAA